MGTCCKYCGSCNVKWVDVSTIKENPKWELWNYEEGFPPHYKHDCGFKGFGNCSTCNQPIRWKECFDTVKGNHFKPYDHTKNQEHHCKWKHIKHLPPKDRPPY